jgi:hypothetical protein
MLFPRVFIFRKQNESVVVLPPSRHPSLPLPFADIFTLHTFPLYRGTQVLARVRIHLCGILVC